MNATTILYSSWDSNLVGYDGVVLRLQVEGSLNKFLYLLHWWMVMFILVNKNIHDQKITDKNQKYFSCTVKHLGVIVGPFPFANAWAYKIASWVF